MAIIRDWHCKQGEYPSLNDMLLDTIPVNLSHPFFRPKPVRGSFYRLLLPFSLLELLFHLSFGL
jgi:hypothetical protein